MLNDTHHQLQQIAGDAGWDSSTLLLLIARWVDADGHSQPLLDHLAQLAEEEDRASDTL